mmetsp:Transcript_151030/g.263922  ORF Transcript_151030/g.263922 Transcript_151030/m.263922 type:complete len:299 (-) Transcript_151030:233-1129(-)
MHPLLRQTSGAAGQTRRAERVCGMGLGPVWCRWGQFESWEQVHSGEATVLHVGWRFCVLVVVLLGVGRRPSTFGSRRGFERTAGISHAHAQVTIKVELVPSPRGCIDQLRQGMQPGFQLLQRESCLCVLSLPGGDLHRGDRMLYGLNGVGDAAVMFVSGEGGGLQDGRCVRGCLPRWDRHLLPLKGRVGAACGPGTGSSSPRGPIITPIILVVPAPCIPNAPKGPGRGRPPLAGPTGLCPGGLHRRVCRTAACRHILSVRTGLDNTLLSTLAQLPWGIRDRIQVNAKAWKRRVWLKRG